MKLKDLSDLIQVRNHLEKIVNTARAHRNLMNLVTQMDKKFVEGVDKLDLNNLFERDLLLVKIGSETFRPTAADLEYWRNVFEDAKKDDDFTIFSHPDVSIQRIRMEPDDAIAIKPGMVKVLVKEEVSDDGQLALNFADKPTDKEEEEIRDTIKKLPVHVTPTEEGIDETAKELGADEVLSEEVKQEVQKVMEDEKLQAQKDEVEQADQEEIARKVAEAKKKIAKHKKTAKTAKTAKKAFSRADGE